MTTYQVLKGVTGEISPIGEAHEDEKRYKNLETMLETIGEALFNIREVASEAESPEASVRKAGKRAEEWLTALKTSP